MSRYDVEKDLYLDFRLKKADIIINTELEKSNKKIDAQLIENCFLSIESLQPYFLSQQDVKNSVAEITSTPSVRSFGLSNTFKRRFRKYIIIPTVILLSIFFFVILLTPSIVSGDESPNIKYHAQIQALGPGEVFVHGNYEYRISHNVEQIPSHRIEEYLYFSDLDYLYPTYLPDDVKIHTLFLDHDWNTAFYRFEEKSYYFNISISPADGKHTDEYDTYVGRYKCLFFDNTELGLPCYAEFEYNGQKYSCSFRSKEEAIKVIGGMI